MWLRCGKASATEEAAGAFAAVEGVKKLDPGAGLLTEGLAALGGFEGVKKLTEHLQEKKQQGEALNDTGGATPA